VTDFADRFHALACAVADRGCAVPVAWKVLAGGRQEEWHPHGRARLARAAAALGPGWEVVVLTDRGPESPRLFAAITAPGWHPLMRVKAGGKFRPAGRRKFYPLGWFAARGAALRRGRAGLPRGAAGLHAAGLHAAGLHAAGLAQAGLRRAVALADRPGAGGGAVLVRLPQLGGAGVQGAQGGRLGLGGDAHHGAGPGGAAGAGAGGGDAVADRGRGLAEGEPRPETVPPLPKPRAGPARWARLFRVGLGLIVAGVIRGQVPVGRFVPEAWPAPQPVPEISEDEFCSQLTYP
jgi:hypothetical protein